MDWRLSIGRNKIFRIIQNQFYMKFAPFCLFVLLLIATVGYSQAKENNYTISGYVKDAISQETLIGASILEVEGGKGTSTNVYGFFSLTLPAGKYTLVGSYIGYQSFRQEVDLQSDLELSISLEEGETLAEVVITAEQAGPSRHEESQMSVNQISMAKVKALPVLLGERDVLKIIQLLPGVQSGAEGTSGLYVRGGGPDQNLMLLDGVPIYNANHLFGFLSTFNGDAVKSASIIKGGFPARYGGRLSSIVDIRMKEGNMSEYHGNASLGIISGKLSVEGPIVKDKTSFSISGRRTWFDAITTPIQNARVKRGKQEGTGNYFFYDLNAKINHKFSDKNRLYLSTYLGDDKLKFAFQDDFQASENEQGTARFDNDLNWGNRIVAARWNLQWSPKLFSNTTLTYSQYDYELGGKYDSDIRQSDATRKVIYEYGSTSQIKDFGAKIDLNYVPNPNHYIRFGGGYTNHAFTPTVVFEKANFEGDTTNVTSGNKKVFADEYFAYVEDDMRIGNRIKVNAGLHFAGFRVGKSNYTSFQPRFTVSYLLNDKMSIKGSYAHMTQFIHLLTNPGLGLPTDLWVPSTDRIKPETSVQYAAAFTRTLPGGFEMTVEGFYKEMNNLVEYKAGVNVFGSSQGWEDKIEVGDGESYGAEFLLEKKTGKTTGWLGYTLSWSNRTFKNINDGQPFPYRYDRRHDLSLAVTHKASDRIDFGLVWIYGTGNTYTLATQRFFQAHRNRDTFYDGDTYQPILDFTDQRNNQRMPAYHRLDLSVNLHKEKNFGRQTWSFGVYNAYSRQNPFAVYLTEDFDGKAKLKQISLLPILPFVSYNLAF